MSRPNFTKHTATIANGASVSGAIRLDTEQLVAIVTPAAWTAAVLEFELSVDGGLTWLPVVDDAAAAVSVASATVAAGARAIVAATIINKLKGLPLIRLASGAAGARVNQGADRAFVIISTTP